LQILRQEKFQYFYKGDKKPQGHSPAANPVGKDPAEQEAETIPKGRLDKVNFLHHFASEHTIRLSG
jgi:hypothetical protein